MATLNFIKFFNIIWISFKSCSYFTRIPRFCVSEEKDGKIFLDFMLTESDFTDEEIENEVQTFMFAVSICERKNALTCSTVY